MKRFATNRCYKERAKRSGSYFHIVRRGRIFHFRRAVPADLRERLKRREWSAALVLADRRSRGYERMSYIGSPNNFSKRPRKPHAYSGSTRPSCPEFLQPHPGTGRAPVRASGVYFTNDGRIARANTGGMSRRKLVSRWAEILWIMERTPRDCQPDGRPKMGRFNEAERSQCKETVFRAGIDLAEALKARYEGDFEFEPKSKLLRQSLLEVAVAARCRCATNRSRKVEGHCCQSAFQIS